MLQRQGNSIKNTLQHGKVSKVPIEGLSYSCAFNSCLRSVVAPFMAAYQGLSVYIVPRCFFCDSFRCRAYATFARAYLYMYQHVRSNWEVHADVAGCLPCPVARTTGSRLGNQPSHTAQAAALLATDMLARSCVVESSSCRC